MTAATVIFVLCCLLSSARLVIDAPTPASLTNTRGDIATRADQRFAAMKAALPGRGVIGYIGEPGTPGVGDYYLAQYALAPLVVDSSPNHAWVVSNFRKSPLAPALPADLHLVKDFGDELLLFSNPAFANHLSPTDPPTGSPVPGKDNR